MKITIEARALSNPSSGVRRYVEQLIPAIIKQPDITATLLYDSPALKGTFSETNEHVVPRRLDALLPYWLHVQIPRALRKIKPDLVHFTKADIPMKSVVPTVVTIYDVIPLLLPQSQTPLRRAYWKRTLQRTAKKADHILTISDASKRDIVNLLGVQSEKVTVTPLSVDTNAYRPVSKRIQHLPENYILFLGSNDPRKNLGAVLAAFRKIREKIPHTLVIAGTAKGPQNEERVQTLGRVSEQDMPALYSGADLFVYPSIIEGWGFPPQEAMSCGTPVIVSNGDPLPEVVGDAGEVVPFASGDLSTRLQDETFIDELAARMLDVLNDPAKMQRMTNRGLAKVRERSWSDVAEETISVYRSLL